MGAEVRIEPENWPWSPEHPDHERFVAEFWRTYTEQAVHFARIAQQEGVRMFGLGTETDGLFRTRARGYWRNHFLEELQAMVAGVREVFDGLVTYDQHYSALLHDHYEPQQRLWRDLDLDVVGLSAWFPLADRPPTRVLSVEYFQQQYDRIFREHLVSLASRNEKPVVLLEHGVVDMVDRPYEPDLGEGAGAPYSDRNGNGLDDGEEQQANVLDGLLRTVSAYPGVVYGAFFWDNWIVSEERWRQHVKAYARGFSFRGKLAERVVSGAYERFGAGWPRTFTDHPIVPGVTRVRAVHFTELQDRIDGVREAAGLPPMPWAYPARPGMSIRVLHLLELRWALEVVYIRTGRPAPQWTDPSPAPGRTPIRAAHLMELRAAVQAQE